jgi:RHS repeat-associated protein
MRRELTEMTMRITRIISMFVVGILLASAPASAQEEVVYYHTDAIGSVRAITDATGAVLGRYDYLPFGELWPSNPPAPAEVRQFGGKERDGETGLDYFGARYHRAQSGRFTSVDPVLNIEAAMIDPQRWNRYAYALNNPMKFTDPDGRDPRLVGGVIGTVVYAAWNAYANVKQGQSWYQNIGIEASKGFVVGATLGLAAPAVGAPVAAVSAVGSAAATSVATGAAAIGFAAGTGRLAFVPDRLQHASRHLTEVGILGNWSKATGQRFIEIGAHVLENPRATFDHVLRGGEAVKGFLGSVSGRDVVFFVYKSGQRAGQIATSYVPSDAQMARWGLR